MHTRHGLIAGLLLAALACITPARAQYPVPATGSGEPAATELPERLTRAEVRDIVSRLPDDEVRALLIGQLDKVAMASEAVGMEGGAADELMQAGDRARDRLLEILSSSRRLGAALDVAWRRLTGDGETSPARLALSLLLAIVVAWLAERLFVRMAGSIGQRKTTVAAPKFLARCGLLVLRAVCDLLGILIGFLAAAGTLFVLLRGNESAPLVLIEIVGIIAAVRAAGALSNAVLAPHTPWLRPLPIGDAAARAIHARVVAFCALWLLSGVPSDVLGSLGVETAVVRLTTLVMSAVLIAGLVLMVLQGQRPMADFIRSGSETAATGDRFRDTLASRWHVFATMYLVALWVLAIGIRLSTGEEVSGRAIASMLMLVAIPVVDGALRAACARVFAPSPREAEAPLAAPATAPDDSAAAAATAAEPASPETYELAMLRNLRILLALLWIVLFAGLWNLDLNRLAEAAVGGRLASSLFEIVLTVVLAYALWSLVQAAVERVVGKPGGASGDGAGSGEIGGPGVSRVATLLPLLRKVVAIALVVMVAMIVLSALGVNIGPLIAGAGMIGLAVGFGAQTLVRDVISGFFFLLDDAFRMGEYVEIDAIRGSVERISVRSLRLRHHNGPVHTIPFGDIRHITNYSRDWAIMKFEIRLPFETDINKVRKIIKGIGEEMIADETLGDGMLEPLKSQGVNRMDDSALIVRCKFTSKPGEQFVLRREAYTRIQTALAAAGIHFAPRRVIVETSDGRAPTAVEAQAAAGSVDTEPSSKTSST
jgi:small-conductance mechanosensitive channel